MNRQTNGFTLIELLIVVVIIGILAAIAIPKFSATREKAYVSTLKADLRNLASLQEVYYNNNHTFTSVLSDVGFDASDGVNISFGEATNLGWSASAAHAGLPDQACALYHGNAAALTPATVPSSVECSR